MPARIPLLSCLPSVIPLDILLGISTCIFGTANKELLFLLTIFPCFVLFRFFLGVGFPFLLFWRAEGRLGWHCFHQQGSFPHGIYLLRSYAFSFLHLLLFVSLCFCNHVNGVRTVSGGFLVYYGYWCWKISRSLGNSHSFLPSGYYTILFLIFFSFAPYPTYMIYGDDGFYCFFPGFRYTGLSYQLMVSLFLALGLVGWVVFGHGIGLYLNFYCFLLCDGMFKGD